MKMIQHNIKPLYVTSSEHLCLCQVRFSSAMVVAATPMIQHYLINMSNHIRRFFERSFVIMLMINKGCSTGSLKMAIQAMPGLFTFPSSVTVPSLAAVSLVKTFSGWRPERVHPTSIRAVVMFWDCDCVWISVLL